MKLRAPVWFAALTACAGLALPLLASRAAAQPYYRPVTCPSCIGYWYYIDEGGTDWNCGVSTYDGHTGSDYSLRNNNRGIEEGNEVVAIAAGTVVNSEDGYFDHCTQCGGANCGTGFGNGFANQVIINHGSYRVIYGHMRMGSIAVQTGDTVTCGQKLGEIGSSGCSTGAHLHVEPRTMTGNFGGTAVDPYVGDCSPTPMTLWATQGPYRSVPGGACDSSEPPPPACPADTYPIWTCNPGNTARRRCVQGMDTTEECPGGCTVMPTGTDDVCALPPDADRDGSRADVDCNDGNAALHPGAVEVCGDGMDQDCSGADQTCPTATAGMPASGSGDAAGVGGGAGAAGVPPITQSGNAAPQPALPGAGAAGFAPAGAAGFAVPVAGAAGYGWFPTMPAQSGSDSGCSTARVRAGSAAGAWPFLIAVALGLTRRRLRVTR